MIPPVTTPSPRCPDHTGTKEPTLKCTEGFFETTGARQLRACLKQGSGYIEETGPCDSMKAITTTLYAIESHPPLRYGFAGRLCRRDLIILPKSHRCQGENCETYVRAAETSLPSSKCTTTSTFLHISRLWETITTVRPG